MFQWLAVDEPPHFCSDFFVEVLGFLEFGRGDEEPGCVLVRWSDPMELLGRDVPLPKFRSVSGTVTSSFVNFEDFPDFHDSHDFTLDLRLDPLLPDFPDLPILSDWGKASNREGIPDTLHLEWETGILPTQVVGDGYRFFPRWAWPSVGDRVWANGYWIFDCGHPANGSLQTEIHPMRAIASMRQQVAIPPGSTDPIPVTATDLYIHGRAGVATDVLECGQGVVLDDRTCQTRADQLAKGWTRANQTPKGCDTNQQSTGCDPKTDPKCYPCHDPVSDHLGVSIDENFEFDICTPPQPGPDAVLNTWVERGGDTVTDPTRAPVLATVAVGDPALDPCPAGHQRGKFGPLKVHVTIPLAGSGVTPDDVYNRTIYAGWVGGEPVRLRHFLVTLDAMRLIHDNEPEGSDDCECTFFWMNVDQALNEWIRLSDFAIGTPSDPLPMPDFGAGEQVNFRRTAVISGQTGMVIFTEGSAFGVSVPDGQPFTIRANGYDGGYGEGSRDPGQDCFDDHFDHHDFAAHVDVNLTSFFDICYEEAKRNEPGGRATIRSMNSPQPSARRMGTGWDSRPSPLGPHALLLFGTLLLSSKKEQFRVILSSRRRHCGPWSDRASAFLGSTRHTTMSWWLPSGRPFPSRPLRQAPT